MQGRLSFKITLSASIYFVLYSIVRNFADHKVVFLVVCHNWIRMNAGQFFLSQVSKMIFPYRFLKYRAEGGPSATPVPHVALCIVACRSNREHRLLKWIFQIKAYI